MGVEFEEENLSFDTNRSDNTDAQSAQFGKVQARATPLNQGIMLFFALICIVGAFILPKLLSSQPDKEIVYFEDITEARMRLIPADEREAYLSKLPYRNNKQ